MKYRDEEYIVKWRQLDKLKEELEKIKAFHELMTNSDGSFCWVIDAEEEDIFRTHEQFSQALRELKLFVEDVSGQEIGVCQG